MRFQCSRDRKPGPRLSMSLISLARTTFSQNSRKVNSLSRSVLFGMSSSSNVSGGGGGQHSIALPSSHWGNMHRVRRLPAILRNADFRRRQRQPGSPETHASNYARDTAGMPNG